MAVTSLFSLIAPMVGPMVVRNLAMMMWGITFVITLASSLAWIVAIRPTIEPKNYAYFKKYIFALPGIALIFVIWFSTGLEIVNLIAKLPYMVIIFVMGSFLLGFVFTEFFL